MARFTNFGSGSISWPDLQVIQMEASCGQTSEVLPAWAFCAFGNVSSWQNHQALTEWGGLASRWWGLPAWLVTYQSNLRIDKSIKHRQSAHRGISRKANRTQSLLSKFWTWRPPNSQKRTTADSFLWEYILMKRTGLPELHPSSTTLLVLERSWINGLVGNYAVQ